MIRPRTPLARDERGAALVEFAMVAPVMLTVLFGLIELGYRHYVLVVLQGALQDAARHSTIERHANAAGVVANDAALQTMVRRVSPGATFVASRRIYASFTDARSGEHYTDGNSNGRHDPGECFEDVNGNGMWDADRGRNGDAGQAGPDDLVRYTVRVTYPLLFPLGEWLGWGPTAQLEASTLLKNQPFGERVIPTVALCS